MFFFCSSQGSLCCNLNCALFWLIRKPGSGNFDIDLEGLDICGDKDEGLSSEGQKSVVDFDKPITAVEERHHSDSTVEGAGNHFFKNRWPLKQFPHLCLNPPSARLGDIRSQEHRRAWLSPRSGETIASVGVVCMH